MTKEQLVKSLDYVDHSREKRIEMAQLVSNNSHLIRPLFEIAKDDDSILCSKACWVLEFTAKENLPYLFPHLDLFTSSISSLKLESSIRPMAKICEYLILGYFKHNNTQVQNYLTELYLERITAACFDWLIGDHKVAPKAYAMTCLLLLGNRFQWIHPELKIILEQNYASGSAAYKARARMTLAKIK